MSDLVIDFESHLRSGHVYLVEVELPWQDSPDEAPSSITADVYVVAVNHDQAQYLVSTMYPDYASISSHHEPVTEFEYAARRNRGIL